MKWENDKFQPEKGVENKFHFILHRLAWRTWSMHIYPQPRNAVRLCIDTSHLFIFRSRCTEHRAECVRVCMRFLLCLSAVCLCIVFPSYLQYIFCTPISFTPFSMHITFYKRIVLFVAPAQPANKYHRKRYMAHATHWLFAFQLRTQAA